MRRSCHSKVVLLWVSVQLSGLALASHGNALALSQLRYLLDAILVTWLQHLSDQSLPFGLLLDYLDVESGDTFRLMSLTIRT